MTADKFVVPGNRICALEEDHIAGFGTYSQHGYIYASLAGILKLCPVPGAGNSKITSVQVEIPSSSSSSSHDESNSSNSSSLVPSPGDIVTCKVLSVNPRFAKVGILCVRDTPLSESFRAQIRKEDVRATEKDKVEMYKSFRPCDIVLGRIISLGEANSGYLVSTSENELGVVVATSAESDKKMIPVSWTEMQCPKTFVKEYRKIAKVVPEDIDAK